MSLSWASADPGFPKGWGGGVSVVVRPGIDGTRLYAERHHKLARSIAENLDEYASQIARNGTSNAL